MQTATADPLVGRLLEGRYRLLDRIARGGMSTVYAAVDERLDRRVAVKVMSSALSDDPKFTDRFAREARAAARLAHVNAVAVYDQGVDTAPDGQHVFLVMELVQGRTLRDLIRERQGRFNPAEAISIMEPVLSALSAAHRAGLVHRDVKPENILLSDDGVVKVADFGLARAVDADVASTRTGLMMGTIAYCAPEQITHGRCDQRSDVYSAGIVLFELLTGRPPYHGDSAMNVAFQHVNNRVPAPSSRAKGIPTPIDEIVVAATDSDPSGRPADASAFLAEVADTRALLNLPIVPIPPRKRPVMGHPANGRRRTPDKTSTTAPVPPHTADALTEVVDRSFLRHDTQVVPRRPEADPPPPPVVIPPPKGRRASTPRTRRRRRRVVVLFVVVLLGALSVAGGFAGVHKWQAWNTRVPKLAGYSAAQAKVKLHQTGYAIDDNVTNQFSETVAKGVVIRTDPGAGLRVEQGKTVRLVVSLGKDRVPVPDLARQSLVNAEAFLQGRGLHYNPSPKTKHSIFVRQGVVISTFPTAGSPIKRSQQIVFVVSSGPPMVAIPSIPAATAFARAKDELSKARFRITRVDDFSDTVPVGDVISFDPSGQAVYGSPVTVTVSKGPDIVTVPAFTAGSPVADVEASLDQLGIKYVLNKLLGGVQGRVLNLNPPSGTQVHRGDTVTITVV